MACAGRACQPFSKRMLQQVELALRSDCQCAITLDELRIEASAAGLLASRSTPRLRSAA